jgi:RNA polymerase sigma factor (sigma-70 family)
VDADAARPESVTVTLSASNLPATGEPDALQTYLAEMARYRLLTHEETLQLSEIMVDAKTHFLNELSRVPRASRHAVRLCREWIDKGRPLSQLLDAAPHDGATTAEEKTPAPSERQQLLSRIDALEQRYQQWSRRKSDASLETLASHFKSLAPNIHLLRKVWSDCKHIAVRLAPERAVGAAQVLQQLEEAAGTDRKTLDEVRRQVQGADCRYSQAWENMVHSNLRLVVSVVRRFATTSVPLEDLIQEGNTGLFRAVEKYDHRLGYRFSTYASFWIRQAVTKAFVNQSRTMRIPAHMNDKILKLFNLRVDLQQKLGRAPTPSELARQGELPLETVQLALESAQATLSLDSPISEGESGTFQDIIPDTSARSAEEAEYASELRRVMSSLLERLPAREALILRLRNGIGVSEAMTLEQIAQVVGVSRERIRQLEARAMMTLRGHIESDAADLADDNRFVHAHEPLSDK